MIAFLKCSKISQALPLYGCVRPINPKFLFTYSLNSPNKPISYYYRLVFFHHKRHRKNVNGAELSENFGTLGQLSSLTSSFDQRLEQKHHSVYDNKQWYIKGLLGLWSKSNRLWIEPCDVFIRLKYLIHPVRCFPNTFLAQDSGGRDITCDCTSRGRRTQEKGVSHVCYGHSCIQIAWQRLQNLVKHPQNFSHSITTSLYHIDLKVSFLIHRACPDFWCPCRV